MFSIEALSSIIKLYHFPPSFLGSTGRFNFNPSLTLWINSAFFPDFFKPRQCNHLLSSSITHFSGSLNNFAPGTSSSFNIECLFSAACPCENHENIILFWMFVWISIPQCFAPNFLHNYDVFEKAKRRIWFSFHTTSEAHNKTEKWKRRFGSI